MSSSTETSPSLLNNLRCFRFQKKSVISHQSPENVQHDNVSDSPIKVEQVRRRIKPIEDSDSDAEIIQAAATATPCTSYDTVNENSNSSTTNDYVVKGKELKVLMDAFPTVDIMILQDMLLKHDWKSDSAMVELLEMNVKKRPQNRPPSKKKTKRRKANADSDDSDFGNSDYRDTRVYNSSDEDSDVEVTNEMTSDKKRVLDFLQSATANELRLMASCSQKKVDVILSLRPFNSWIELVEKINESKYLSTDLLNAAQQVLATRNNVRQLMKKCTNLATQMERAVAAGAGVKSQPRLLNPNLHLTNYQMIGLNWLAVMHAQGVNGILADEMGLGKTVQVIAFLAHLKEMGLSQGTHLVIVPSSTLDNWKNEFERWCPELNVFTYYGSSEERKMIRIGWSREGIHDIDVILTTYTMVITSSEERKMFRVTQMHYVVFDEAHMLKNMNTLRYENLIRIKAMNRILLTGTPLQNNLLELMSLLIFVMPTMFAGKTNDLKSLFQKSGKNQNAGENNDLPTFERDQIKQAKRIMKPFVLRRLKSDVLQELPTKTDNMICVPMEATQKSKYEDLISNFQNREMAGSNDYNGMTMMMDLRKLSNHPLLLRYYYDYDEHLPVIASRLAKDPFFKETNKKYIIDDLACMSDFEIHQLTKEYKSISSFKLPNDLLVKSGKFQHLDKVLPELKAGGHRVLIFSQFVIVLNLMEEYLKIRNYNYVRLDGSTPVSTRQDLINDFTEDDSIFIFLLSTRAGGLGINLTAADTVIIHDIDFNPYNDKQAEDRCHRMGQKKPVSIFRLISSGTIEEGMYQMALEKLKLEKEITTEENEKSDVKGVVRLLTLALGLDSNRAEKLVSPKKISP